MDPIPVPCGILSLPEDGTSPVPWDIKLMKTRMQLESLKGDHMLINGMQPSKHLFVVSTFAHEYLPAQPFAKVGNFETSSIDEARATNF